MLNRLQFTTHNDCHIDVSACAPAGDLSSSFGELENTFGLPRVGAGGNIEWAMRFADGLVAQVCYTDNTPETDSWRLLSTGDAAERIKTVIGIAREEAFKPETECEQMQAAQEAVMTDIERKHGTQFASLVRIAHLAWKVQSLASVLLDGSDIPKRMQESGKASVADMSAELVARAAALTGCIRSERDMHKVLDAVQRLSAIEERVARRLAEKMA